MDTNSGFDAYEHKHAAMVALEAEVFPANKVSLFAALASAGITAVTVTFDGSGDRGQVESVTATDVGGQTVELPEGKIAFQEGVGAWIRFSGLMPASGLRSFDAVQAQCPPPPSHSARPLPGHELACV